MTAYLVTGVGEEAWRHGDLPCAARLNCKERGVATFDSGLTWLSTNEDENRRQESDLDNRLPRVIRGGVRIGHEPPPGSRACFGRDGSYRIGDFRRHSGG